MTGMDSEFKRLFAARIRPWLVSEAGSVSVGDEIGQGVYIYGAGELGTLALEYCEACGIPVLGILDRSRMGWLQSKSGKDYEVRAPDSTRGVLDKNARVAVAIATIPYEPIRDQLHDYGWRYVLPFYNLTLTSRKGHPLRNGWQLGNVTSAEIATVEWLCEHWSDEKSWRHYEAFIAWHRDNSEIDPVECPIEADQRYAIPELLGALVNRQDQFVDVGSHRGESVCRLTKAGLHFKESFLFEPDAASRAYLLSHIDKMQDKGARVTVLSDILAAVSHNVNFQDGLGYCSQVWVEGTDKRQAIPLDSLNLNPDFLKVHTEGTELEILQGARDTISRVRPCIAFSVYHRREGFYSDIADAMEMFSGYQWFFRLHSYQGTGAFVYAIPC